jgi:hypothetical protein
MQCQIEAIIDGRLDRVKGRFASTIHDFPVTLPGMRYNPHRASDGIQRGTHL